MLVAKNEKTNLQKATMETIKCPIGRTNLQHQLTLHSLDKQKNKKVMKKQIIKPL
jgi:hypothetical protein